MKKIHVVQLYINEMNTYGDRGNLMVLAKRIIWQGYEPVIHYYHLGGSLPEQVDIVLGGGGQDSAQTEIQKDIQRISDRLHNFVNRGTPMLMVCGCYQLFGHRFVTSDGQEVKGIGIFDIETIASPRRLIGNVAIKTKDFGMMYGFENHSGRTKLGPNQSPLGIVVRGNGNNGNDKTEGARINNVFGTYLHGPVLPNNPDFTDAIISMAAKNAFGNISQQVVDNGLSDRVRAEAKSRHY